MPKANTRKKKPHKRVLALPDLEHAKAAGLNSLTSASGLGSRSTASSCSASGSTSSNEGLRLRPSTFGSQRFGVSRTRLQTPAF
jgi:hypothetical protein